MADTATTGTAAAAQTNEPLIRVEGLRKSFGSLEVLKGIDLSVNPGEVVTIIGASGSGKSTFLRCLNLLETPDAGHIWFHGQDLTAERCNINRVCKTSGWKLVNLWLVAVESKSTHPTIFLTAGAAIIQPLI